jgi:hypothetical protein
MARAGFFARFLQPYAVAAFVGLLAACGGGGGGGGGVPVRTVTTVTVTSLTVAPKQGDTVQLTAVARDQFGDLMTGTTATWSSSAPTVATVSTTGLLQALAGGSVTITATVSGVSGTLALTITPRVTTTVTVSSPTLSLAVGETVQLAVVARDQFGDVIPGKSATWSVSDARVATISPSGLLQAVAPGTVVATATIDAVPGSLTLTVVPGTVASVIVSAPTLTPKEGDAVQLTAVARDQFGDIVPGVTATWSVSDANLAAISTTGLLQTYATGTVQARATVAGVTGAVSLTVSAIKVSVTFGAKEVVFDYTTDRCEDLDLPDQPARFVRAEDGNLVLIDGNAPKHYVSRGADFSSLTRVCNRAALVSADLRTAESYENWEWLWVVYREGSRWHALIHNEFHDAVSSTCRVGDPSPGNPCWYNSITYAASDDGGAAFVKPLPPQHVVAPAPNFWVPPPPGAISPSGYWFAEGYRAPTNVVRAGDGYYYSLIELFPSKFSDSRGLCVMRTDRLDDPASWRAWDGVGFNLRMTSPYVTGSAAPMCTYLSRWMDGMGGGHLVYSTYLSRYTLVAPTGGQIDGRNTCGFAFSFSSDLIHWSEPQLLVEAKLTYCPTVTPGPGAVETLPTLYPSLVDHGDTTINFERAGRSAYLYYTRFNDGGLDRDLVRVPITFTRVD